MAPKRPLISDWGVKESEYRSSLRFPCSQGKFSTSVPRMKNRKKGRPARAELPGFVYSLVKMDWLVVFGTSGSVSLIRFSAIADASARILFASSLFSAW